MPGKPNGNPDKTQQEEIAEKKAQCVEVYAALGVKKAAAAAIGRSLGRVCKTDRFTPRGTFGRRRGIRDLYGHAPAALASNPTNRRHEPRVEIVARASYRDLASELGVALGTIAGDVTAP